MFWRFIKQLPKLALVLVVFLGSTGLFAWWWYFHSPEKREAQRIALEKRKEIIAMKAAIAAERMGRLFLAGGTLYDVDTGEAIFGNWLNGETPLRLSYDAAAKKLMAQFPRGFVRYNLDGTHDAEMGLPAPPAFSDDLKWLVYSRNKDVWRADVDWQAFRFVNQRQVTKLGAFNDQYFSAGLKMASDKILVVEILNKLLRVNLETGEVTPTKIPLGGIDKRRAPDGRFLVGFMNSQFFTYDLDTDKTDSAKIGRTALNDCQWLNKERCALLLGGKTVALYDRKAKHLGEVCTVASGASRIGIPSPDGNFVLCQGHKELLLVDVDGKKTEALPLDGKGFVWLDDRVLMFSREMPDTNLRGTWIKVIGEGERRVTPEPFYVNTRGQGAVLLLKDAGLVIIESRTALMKMKPDGSELRELAKLGRSVERLQAIEGWER